LPDSIGDMRVHEISLENNQLKKLPESIAKLKDQLKKLRLKNNPLSASEKERICQLLPNTKIMFK
jgi:Leucine-rich repeat (LRR) protein